MLAAPFLRLTTTRPSSTPSSKSTSGISSGSTSDALRASAALASSARSIRGPERPRDTNSDGVLKAFYNVCSHRGAVLCDELEGATKAVFQCPYHAWCYDLDGELVATPRVDKDEVDRSALGLKPIHIDEWQGFIFVNLTRDEPKPLRQALDSHYDSPLRFEKHEMDLLVTIRQTESVVAANWKS